MIKTFFLMAVLGFLSLLSAGVKVTVTPDIPARKYRCNEPAVFTIGIHDDGNAVTRGKVKITVSNGLKTAQSKNIDLSGYGKKAITVSGTSTQPDIMYCDAVFSDGRQKVSASAAVVFDPEKIAPALPEPADFKKFWERSLAHAATFPAATRKFTGVAPNGCKVYDITVPVPGGAVKGFLSVPPEPGRYPVIVQIPGAGAGMDRNPFWDRDFIRLSLNVHQYPPENSQQEYKKLCAASHKRIAYSGWGAYIYDGASKRQTSYYYRVLLGASRAVDFVSALPEAMPGRIGYCGVSQGGGLGLMLAAVNKKITAVSVAVPAFCDHGAFQQQRAEAWPEYGKFFRFKKLSSFEEVLYFDAVNFARYIDCPVQISAGMNDRLCPLPTIIAAWSVIPSKAKELFIEPEIGHGTGEKFKNSVNWLKSVLKGQ